MQGLLFVFLSRIYHVIDNLQPLASVGLTPIKIVHRIWQGNKQVISTQSFVPVLKVFTKLGFINTVWRKTLVPLKFGEIDE